MKRRHDHIEIQHGQLCFGREWKSFVDEHSRAIFQTALLLAADQEEAENALIASLDGLDFARRPQPNDFSIWENALVKAINGSHRRTPAEGASAPASSLLQPDLRPLLQIGKTPRICFVLKCLLGYTTAACADILGVEESEIPTLLAEAAAQLQKTRVAAV